MKEDMIAESTAGFNISSVTSVKTREQKYLIVTMGTEQG